MPNVAGKHFPYTRKGRRQAQAAATSRGGGLPPNPKPGLKPGVPAGPPVQKDVRPMSAGGPPKSTLPLKGSLGKKGGVGRQQTGLYNPELLMRLRERLGKEAKGQGAYNILHRKGKPIDALKAARAKQKSQFGGPDDGRKPATGRKKKKRAAFGEASSV